MKQWLRSITHPLRYGHVAEWLPSKYTTVLLVLGEEKFWTTPVRPITCLHCVVPTTARHMMTIEPLTTVYYLPDRLSREQVDRIIRDQTNT